MQLDDFKQLIEIQSLQRYIKGHLAAIGEHRKRFDYVAIQVTNKKDRLKEIETQITELAKQIAFKEQEFAQVEKTLERNHENERSVKTEQENVALMQQRTLLETSHTQLETGLLNSFEKQDELNKERDQLQKFLTGAEQTLQSIQAEIEQEVAGETAKINGYEKRIQDGLDTIPDKAKKLFLQIDQKYRFNSPLAFVLNHRNCSQCSLEIDSMTRQALENSLSLETCPGCGRLLIPPAAQTS